ncbi:Csu type fimbrial protein [Pluralibacter gergoviae]|uniref:Csu type fimbrial protein n=1 Tax=Pluralibacter gergoviae TaxID=61647 RepID=UPI003EE05C45
MKFKQKTALAISAAGLLFVGTASGEGGLSGQTSSDVNQTMEVSLTVEAACKMSVSDLSFGTHGSNDGDLNEHTEAKVTCTSGVPYTLTAESPDHYAMMNDANDEVHYMLFTDSERKTSLTDLVGIEGTGSGEAQTQTIYGRVDAAELAHAAVGSYRDAVVLQVSY